jgi:predicted nucleic acid-binding protein
MIVVSNTSPLTNLAAIGKLSVLEALYGEVHVPAAVWNELTDSRFTWPGQASVVASDWIRRHSVASEPLVTVLRRDLDAGEAEAIALAMAMRADLVLLDEREARRSAERLGLARVGVLGVLLEAKRARLLEQIEPSLRALREVAGFYLSEPLCDAVLRLAGELE